MYLKWHKVIVHPCWHSQRKRWVMDTLLIQLQHSRTESPHPGGSGGADSAHQTGAEHSVAGSQFQNQLKVQIKSQDLGLPYCLTILAAPPSPTLTLGSCISTTLAAHADCNVHLPHIAEVSFSTI